MAKSQFESVNRLYGKLFKQLAIHPRTGRLAQSSFLKFATFPYVGREYGKGTKILFIGLDVGSDEFQDGIIDLRKRQHDIGSDEKFPLAKYNPHIAGTAVAAIYFANPSLWQKIKKAKSYHEAIRLAHAAGSKNPLKTAALTNFYKFVTVGRTKKMGGENRRHVAEEAEKNLLLEEIRFLAPDIIFFQSKQFLHPRYKDFLKSVREAAPRAEIVVGSHPSNWTARTPAKYAATFKKIRA